MNRQFRYRSDFSQVCIMKIPMYSEIPIEGLSAVCLIMFFDFIYGNSTLKEFSIDLASLIGGHVIHAITDEALAFVSTRHHFLHDATGVTVPIIQIPPAEQPLRHTFQWMEWDTNGKRKSITELRHPAEC